MATLPYNTVWKGRQERNSCLTDWWEKVTKIWIIVLQNVTSCSLVNTCQHFGGTWCLPSHGRTSSSILEILAVGPPKRWRISPRMHYVTTQKTIIWISTTPGTSNIMGSNLLQADCFDSNVAVTGCYAMAICQCINLGKSSYDKAFTILLYPLPLLQQLHLFGYLSRCFMPCLAA